MKSESDFFAPMINFLHNPVKVRSVPKFEYSPPRIYSVCAGSGQLQRSWPALSRHVHISRSRVRASASSNTVQCPRLDRLKTLQEDFRNFKSANKALSLHLYILWWQVQISIFITGRYGSIDYEMIRFLDPVN